MTISNRKPTGARRQDRARVAAVYAAATVGPLTLTALLTLLPDVWPRPYSWQFLMISIAVAVTGGVGPALVSHTLGTAAVLWLARTFGNLPSPLHPGVEMFATVGVVLMIIIHRLQRAQQELRERNEALALSGALIEQSTDVIFAKDTAGRIRLANPAALALFGKPLDGVLGRPDAEFLEDPAAARALMESDRRILDNGVAEELEARIPLPDGSPRIWLTRTAPYRDTSGKVVGLVAISRDITDRKRAETVLLETQRRLDSALIAGEVGTFQWDVVDDRLAGDQNFARMFNVELDADGAAPLERYLAAIHPQDSGATTERLAETVATGRDYEAELRIISGLALRWVIARGKAEKDSSGRVVRLPGVALDITARKRMEDEAQAAKGRYARLFEVVREGFAHYRGVYDSGTLVDLQVVEINGTGASLFGVPPEHQRGRTWRELWPDIVDERFAPYRHVDETAETVRFDEESRVTRRWYDVSISKAASGEFVVTFFDISERKTAEAENARLAREAQTANRLKDQFLAMLSHELRTPLNVILGYGRMLRTYADTPDRVAHTSHLIERNAVVQMRMVEDLLDVQRILREGMQVERAPFELQPLGQSVVESLHHLVAAKNLHWAATFDRLTINADRARIQQVLWNLLANAIKFTPAGGCIGVSAVQQDRGVVIRVVDSGEGIPSHFMSHIFEPFRQLDMSTTRRHGGLGLGLAIVKHIVEAHGGTIDVESEEGRGTAFTVRLPMDELVERSGPGLDPVAARA